MTASISICCRVASERVPFTELPTYYLDIPQRLKWTQKKSSTLSHELLVTMERRYTIMNRVKTGYLVKGNDGQRGSSRGMRTLE